MYFSFDHPINVCIFRSCFDYYVDRNIEDSFLRRFFFFFFFPSVFYYYYTHDSIARAISGGKLASKTDLTLCQHERKYLSYAICAYSMY